MEWFLELTVVTRCFELFSKKTTSSCVLLVDEKSQGQMPQVNLAGGDLGGFVNLGTWGFNDV